MNNMSTATPTATRGGGSACDLVMPQGRSCCSTSESEPSLVDSSSEGSPPPRTPGSCRSPGSISTSSYEQDDAIDDLIARLTKAQLHEEHSLAEDGQYHQQDHQLEDEEEEEEEEEKQKEQEGAEKVKEEEEQEEEKEEGEEQEQEQKQEEVEVEEASRVAAAASNAAPASMALMDEAVREALEGATAATDRARHDIRDAFNHASIVAMHSEAETVQAWKDVVAAMHTAAVQLKADNAQLAEANETLTSEKRALKAEMEDLVAERDRLVSNLKEPWAESPPGRPGGSKNLQSSFNTSTNFNTKGKFDTNTDGTFNPNGCMSYGLGSPDTGGLDMSPAMPLSAAALFAASSDIAAAVAAAAAVTFPAPGASRAIVSDTKTSPSVDEFPGTTGQQRSAEPVPKMTASSSPCSPFVLPPLAGAAEVLPLAATTPTAITTTTTTAAAPQPVELSSPSALAISASSASAGTDEPLPQPLGTTDTNTTTTMNTTAKLHLAAAAATTASTTPTASAVASTPTAPATPAAAATTTASTTSTTTIPADTAATTASTTPATSAVAATITTTPATSAVAATTATVSTSAATPAVSAATPNRIYTNENESPQYGCSGKVSAGKTGGRPRWVGVGPGDALLSPPLVPSVEKRASTPTYIPTVIRMPLASVPINTTPRSVLADMPRMNRAVASVGTSGPGTMAGISWRDNNGSGCGGGGSGGGMSKTSVTRNHDGGATSVEAAEPRGARRASATRPTLSSKAAARPTPTVGIKRPVPVQRPSTRRRLADREQAEGMAGRLRSARGSTKDAAPAVAAGGQSKVVSGAGVASRTRQATAVAARGAGKVPVVRKRWM